MTLVSVDEAEPIHGSILRKEAWTQDAVRRAARRSRQAHEGRALGGDARRPARISNSIFTIITAKRPYSGPMPIIPADLNAAGRAREPGALHGNKNALNACRRRGIFPRPRGLPAGQRGLCAARGAGDECLVRQSQDAHESEPGIRAGDPGTNTGRNEGCSTGAFLFALFREWNFWRPPALGMRRTRSAVRKWFEDYLRWLTHSKMGDDEKHSGNNHASWFVAQEAAVRQPYVSDIPNNKPPSHFTATILPQPDPARWQRSARRSAHPVAFLFGVQP